MAATFRDYEWVDTVEWEPLDAYCITLFDHISVDAVIEGLSGQVVGSARGVGALSRLSFAQWHGMEMQSAARVFGLLRESDAQPEGYLVGLHPLDGWTLMLEINGFVGVRYEAIGSLSVGSTVVSHYRNVNRYDDLHFWVDGSPVVQFEPHASGWADAPPDVLREIDRAGFEISGLNPRRPVASAAFALAENLTGVRLTPSMLRDAEYTTALVKDVP